MNKYLFVLQYTINNGKVLIENECVRLDSLSEKNISQEIWRLINNYNKFNARELVNNRYDSYWKEIYDDEVSSIIILNIIKLED